jgi:NADH dehydrogenase
MSIGQRPRILIVGGGYVGLYTALRLQRRLRAGEADVVLVDPRSYMTYQPFLPEAGAGSIEPRHVVVPLRQVLNRCEIVNGFVTRIEHARKAVRVAPEVGDPYELSYDVLVVAAGSVVRTLPVPGLAEVGIGFKEIEEAISLRNRVLEELDIAASTTDRAIRRKALTFVFVGGGFAGVEALGELEDMARYALRYYRDLDARDLRFVLVEAAGRILPEVGEELGRYTVERLRERGIEVRLNTRLNSCVGHHIVLSDGDEFDASTLVWTAGVKPSPMLTDSDLPLGPKGHLRCRATLEVDGVHDAWSAGDVAQVPDLAVGPGAWCPPNAQHAVRQSKVLADNIRASLRGRPLTEYRHKSAGSVASLGLYRGAAYVYGIKLRGLAAWLMHRTYHVSRVPTLNRKIRVLADWTLALFFKRDITSLGSLQSPRRVFERVAGAPATSAERRGEPTRDSGSSQG